MGRDAYYDIMLMSQEGLLYSVTDNPKSSAIAAIVNSRVPTRDHKVQLHVGLIVGSELRRCTGNAVSVVTVSLVPMLVVVLVENSFVIVL